MIQNKDSNGDLQSRHTVNIDNRAHTEICGVRDVQSFDETSVILVCEGFELELSGEGLKVSVLDVEKGRAVIEGKICAMYYNEKRASERRGFLSRWQR